MRIAILDDTPSDAKVLQEYLLKYQEEISEIISVDVYCASIDFLEDFKNQYDVIFLDIEMPGEDGLMVAKEIRKTDSSAAIIFVTNMAQYAIEGYKVNAVDFMVKPVGYYVFCDTLKKAIGFNQRRNSRDILINSQEGMLKINSQDILYIEKNQDKILLHTTEGDFSQRGTIKAIKEKLEGLSFQECSSGILVNLAAVKNVGKEEIRVRNVQLPLSRRLKKQFTESYIDYVGGGF